MTERTFTIVRITTPQKKAIRIKGGRYTGDPYSAAKKMARQACKKQKSCQVLHITLRETTSGSDKSEYTYKIKRTKLKKPIKYKIKKGNKTITIKYKYQSISERLSSSPKRKGSSKKTKSGTFESSLRNILSF